MPIDEAAYDRMVASGWDDAAVKEYYDALGITNVELYQGEFDGKKIYVNAGDFENGNCDDFAIYYGTPANVERLIYGYNILVLI